VSEVYSHGHHESVLRSHRWRTAENSAAYMLEELRAGDYVLDAGCGPGTITLDIAGHVAPGRVLGVDSSAEAIASAEELRRRVGVSNVEFSVGDAYALGPGERTFDAAHAHQLLQHLGRPVEALGELRRVLRPGGLLAVRDSDYGAFTWWPSDSRLDRWLELYHEVAGRNGGTPDAGRRLLGWVRGAGFDQIVATSSTWTFADPEARAWWGGLWAERVTLSAFCDQAVAYGLCDEGELAEIARGWLDWSSSDDGWFMVPHGEVIARKPAD